MITLDVTILNQMFQYILTNYRVPQNNILCMLSTVSGKLLYQYREF